VIRVEDLSLVDRALVQQLVMQIINLLGVLELG